jgi:hypothetical protein
MMEMAKGNSPTPISMPFSSSVSLNAVSQLEITCGELRTAKPKAVAMSAIKQPTNSRREWLLSAMNASGEESGIEGSEESAQRSCDAVAAV